MVLSNHLEILGLSLYYHMLYYISYYISKDKNAIEFNYSTTNIDGLSKIR